MIKTGSTNVLAVYATNRTGGVLGLGAAERTLKLYNLAVAPTVGTNTPVMTIPVRSSETVVLPLPADGVLFPLGLGYAITGGIADTDTSTINANEIVINIIYK